MRTKTLGSGVECAGNRSSEAQGEVVLHPKWSCRKYNLDGFALGFLSVFSWSSPWKLDCQTAKLVLLAQAEGFSVEEYKGAFFSLSTGRLVRLMWFAKILLSLRLAIEVGRKASDWSQTRASGRSGKDVRKRS